MEIKHPETVSRHPGKAVSKITNCCWHSIHPTMETHTKGKRGVPSTSLRSHVSIPGSTDAEGGRKASGGRQAEVRWSGIARQRRQSETGAATAGRAALLCHAHVQMQEVRGRDVRPCADEATFPPLTCLRGTPEAAKPAKEAAKVLAGRSRQPMDPARVEGRPTDSGYGGSQEASANRPEPEMTEVASSSTRHEGGSEGGRTGGKKVRYVCQRRDAEGSRSHERQ